MITRDDSEDTHRDNEQKKRLMIYVYISIMGIVTVSNIICFNVCFMTRITVSFHHASIDG